MKLLAALLLVLAALGVAACGDDDDDSGTASAATSAVVAVADVDGEQVLADADGATLYSADVEAGGKIKCEDDCASIWVPAAASADDAASASDELGLGLGTVMRPDGGEQLTLDGAPLYSFAEEGSGELTGDGFEDDFQGTHFVWTAARASGSTPADDQTDSVGGSYGGGY
jgi:predicted lipoprotein with Yx(FWY)xxD motif